MNTSTMSRASQDETGWRAEVGLAEVTTRVAAGDPPIHLVSLTRTPADLSRFPRRIGIPAKRPLF